MSRKKKPVFRRHRKLTRSRSTRTQKIIHRIRTLAAVRGWRTRRLRERARATIRRTAAKRGWETRRIHLKRPARLLVKRKKRVVISKPRQEIVTLKRRKAKRVLAPKKRKQIIRVTERRKFSTRLDFTKGATVPEKFKYLLKQVKRGMILRFVIKAPRGKGSPTKRSKKTGRVTRRSPYISTGWVNFGSLSPERIAYYLDQLGGVDRIERIFYMPKR